MQMILSFLRLVVLYFLLCLTIPSIWSLKSNTKVKSLLFSLLTTCSSKRLGTERTSFRFYYFETIYIVIDISNQESWVCSFTARKHCRLGTKSRGSPPWAPAVTRRSQSSTTIHGNTLLQDKKYTQQYAIHSICDGCNFLSGTRACISQIVCSSHFPNYNLYKALRLGNKEGQDATAIGSQTVFLFTLGRLLAEADTWLWQIWWN